MSVSISPATAFWYGLVLVVLALGILFGARVFGCAVLGLGVALLAVAALAALPDRKAPTP